LNIFSKPYSRRRFLAGTTSLAALYCRRQVRAASCSGTIPANDPRIDKQPIVDKGYALVRKIGNGVYATVSDRSKGLQTRSNGGFIVGRDGALLIEGFQTPIGASFQADACAWSARCPYTRQSTLIGTFDHTLGNSFYIDKGWPVWAHPKAAGYLKEKYTRWHAETLDAFLAPWEKRVTEAKTDSLREHAKSDVEGVRSLYEPNGDYPMALPTHPLDPAKMPMKVDLGGLSVEIENFVGHTDTDLIIRVPDQNIVYMGDLLVNAQYPTNINGYPTSWRATLANIAKFDKDTLFVPGHGQICGMEP